MPEEKGQTRLPAREPSPELLAEARAGDSRAFEWIFKAYWPLVVRMAWGFFWPNRAEVDDAAQEAMLDVHRGIKSFRGKSKFSTWLYRVAKNRMLMTKLKMKTQPEMVPLEECEDLEGATIEEVRERKERLRERLVLEEWELDEERAGFMELAYWISRLPDTTAQAMGLVRLCGLDPQEAAEVLGTSQVALRKRLSRGDREVRRMRNEEREVRNVERGMRKEE